MDLQRSLLIGAIAILSFMLLTEWVAFNDTKTATVAQETSRLMSDATKMPPAPPEPNINTVAPAGEDIPAAPDQSAPDAKPATVTRESTGHIVQVYTDVLQLAIDLNGGDIVELSLPKYLAHLDNPKGPFVLLEDNEALVYIAQSGLIGTDGIDNNGRARFTASAPRFTLKEGEDTLVVDLKWQNDTEVKITKRLTLRRGDYMVDVDYLVENSSAAPWQANLFGQIKRQSGPPPSATNNSMGLKPFLGVAVTQPDEHFTKFTFEDLAEEPFKAKLPGGWIALIQHYFLSAWIPNQEQTHTFSAPGDTHRLQHRRVYQSCAGLGPR